MMAKFRVDSMWSRDDKQSATIQTINFYNKVLREVLCSKTYTNYSYRNLGPGNTEIQRKIGK